MTTVLLIIAAVVVAIIVLDAANRARIRRLRQSGLYPPQGQGTLADVERLVHLGKRIAAIKLYREIHGVGLKEAKTAVDRLARDSRDS